MALTVETLISDIQTRLGEDDSTYFSDSLVKQHLLDSYKDVVTDTGLRVVSEDITGTDSQAYIELTDIPLDINRMVDEVDNIYYQSDNKQIGNDLEDYFFRVVNGKVYIMPEPDSSKTYTVDYVGYEDLSTTATEIDLQPLLKKALLYRTLYNLYRYDGDYNRMQVVEKEYKLELGRLRKHQRSGVKETWNPRYTV